MLLMLLQDYGRRRMGSPIVAVLLAALPGCPATRRWTADGQASLRTGTVGSSHSSCRNGCWCCRCMLSCCRRAWSLSRLSPTRRICARLASHDTSGGAVSVDKRLRAPE